MTPLPLRRVLVSNFRRLRGSWEIPLNAPIVLIHGANGSGKTSVLSAIEFGLTGEIRSMQRRDPRYTAHLPHRGSSFATIEVEIADEHGRIQLPPPITVGGAEIKGAPALDPDRAQFFSERAFLDQVSLGQLLDLYEYTEGNQESALARFVNELLGLDQLDALRFGLHEATDLRRLRNLSNAYAHAESEAARAGAAIDESTGKLSGVESELPGMREELLKALANLGSSADVPDLGGDLREIELLLAELRQPGALAESDRRVRALIELRGRIRGLSSRPTSARLNEARAAVVAAKAAAEEWSTSYRGPVEALRNEVFSLGLDAGPTVRRSLVEEISAIDRRIAEHDSAVNQLGEATQNMSDLQSRLEEINDDISRAESRAGSLASGLAALRDQISGEVCPVCDRDFSEVSEGHLLEHVDRRIEDLADAGAELQTLSDERMQLATRLRSAEQRVSAIEAVVLPESEYGSTIDRREAVAALRVGLDDLSDAITRGAELSAAVEESARELADVEAEDREQRTVTSELTSHAVALDAAAPAAGESPEQAWERLNDIASRRSQQLELRSRSLSDAADLIGRFRDVAARSEELTATIAEAARSKRSWERRVVEADRRRAVARSVHNAASSTRTAIVQRVFTRSLNDVWGDVFSRLAPTEPFVPAFGVPTATKAALELRLETIHRSGGKGGTPSMMLSAGNLNTAALSLFIALHLAVEPKFPCLIFDDPVQSMDEVHIAQFAGLLRVLSKQHDRQVVVAVHERELFEYLALELSPAFEGDELITVELDLGSDGDPVHHSTRLAWTDDAALAILR